MGSASDHHQTNGVKTFSQLVVVGDVHHPPPAPEGGCTFANLPSPLTASCQESSTNMALVPQSLSPSAEIATNNHDCQTTTQVRLQVSRSPVV